MAFPVAHTIGHRAVIDGARDAHGNPVTSWADPVDVTVYGWHTGQSEEPQIAGHDRVRVDGRVFAPESWQPGPRDLVVLPGKGEFKVIAEVEDYNHGPFGWRPGVVVNLRKVTG